MELINKLKSLFSRKKSRRFFVSDLHFGHKNVITYCDRPWSDKHLMNEGLVELWNKQVDVSDTVYILGDFSLSPKVAKDFAPRLNGRKILILGNHDAPFGYETNPKAARMREKYLNEFAEVRSEMMLKLKDGTPVHLAHMPYANSETLQYDTRYVNMRPKDTGSILLHGHLHCAYLKQDRCIDVGIDNNFKLYSEDDIIAIIKDNRSFIPSRLTEKVREKRAGMKGDSSI